MMDVKSPGLRRDESSELSTASSGTAGTAWTHDGCDRCGHSAVTSAYVAQAWFRFTLPSGLELTMCAHHGRAALARMTSLSARIEDLTATLG